MPEPNPFRAFFITNPPPTPNCRYLFSGSNGTVYPFQTTFANPIPIRITHSIPILFCYTMTA